MKKKAKELQTCPRCDADLSDALALLSGGDQLAFCPKCQFPLRLIAGKYRLEKVIGEGAAGTVYLAHHVRLTRDTERVVKILKPEIFSLPGMEERFEREVQITSSISLRNEHIVRIYDDFGDMPGLGHFYVMEYLEGSSLDALLEDEEALPSLELCLHIFEQLCGAMDVAHREKVVHRDLKPENIFLVQRDEEEHFVKVLDFGIAKPTDAASLRVTRLTKGGPLGTPLYMAPEQFSHQDIDHRCDIYAMGVILFEMLVGYTPFSPKGRNATTLEIAMAHMSNEPPRPSALRPDREIPEALDEVVLKALSKKPEERFASTKAFWEAMDAIVVGPFLSVSSPNLMATSADGFFFSELDNTPKGEVLEDGNLLTQEQPGLEEKGQTDEHPSHGGGTDEHPSHGGGRDEHPSHGGVTVGDLRGVDGLGEYAEEPGTQLDIPILTGSEEEQRKAALMGMGQGARRQRQDSPVLAQQEVSYGGMSFEVSQAEREVLLDEAVSDTQLDRHLPDSFLEAAQELRKKQLSKLRGEAGVSTVTDDAHALPSVVVTMGDDQQGPATMADLDEQLGGSTVADQKGIAGVLQVGLSTVVEGTNLTEKMYKVDLDTLESDDTTFTLPEKKEKKGGLSKSQIILIGLVAALGFAVGFLFLFFQLWKS